MVGLGTLKVQLVSADFDKDVDRIHVGRIGLGRQDPYAVVSVGECSLRSKTITDGGKHPTWDQTLDFGSVFTDQRLKLEFFDENMFLRDVPIGSTEAAVLARLLVEAPGHGQALELPLRRRAGRGGGGGGGGGGGEPCGKARVRLFFEPDSGTRGPCSSGGSGSGRGGEAGEGEGGGGGREGSGRSAAGTDPVAASPRSPTSAPAPALGPWVLAAYAGTGPWADHHRDRGVPPRRDDRGGWVCGGVDRCSGERVEVRVLDKRALQQQGERQAAGGGDGGGGGGAGGGGCNREELRREVQVLLHLAGHPNVLRLKGVYEDARHVYLVTQAPCPGGQGCPGGHGGPGGGCCVDLFEVLARAGRHSEARAAALMRGLLSGLAYCHQMGVVHRDVKPDSFVIARCREAEGGEGGGAAAVLATNFKLACFYKEGEALGEVVGTVPFVAPDVLRRHYGPPADVWSAGVVLHMLLAGRPPFSGATMKETLHRIVTQPLDLDSQPWDRISDAAKDCVRRMLVRDPQRRATAQQILQHEWMRENGCATDQPIQLEVLSRIKQFSAMNRLKKEALKLIARGLPPEEVSGLREIFLQIDLDRSGTISRGELREALRRKGAQGLSEGDVDAILRDLDVNGDGQVDYDEFLAATLGRARLDGEERLRQAFAKFDENGDGQITRQELFNALTDPALGADPKEIDEIIDQVDKDGDGTIDYNEFVSMMRGL